MSITPERRREAFAASISFQQFVAGTTNFTDEFGSNYAAAALDAGDLEILARIREPIDVLAIVEDWCPDVVANLPIVARIADETGKLRLHVLVRNDSSRDVADAYPFEGRSHIPTYVLSDSTGTELGIIVERTPEVHEHVLAFIEAFFATHPRLDRAAFPGNLDDELKAELVAGSLSLRAELRDLERRTLIEAITAAATAPTPVSA